MPAGQGSEGSGFKLPYGRVRQPPSAPEPHPIPLPPETKESFFSGIINLLKRIASFVGPTERQTFYELSGVISTYGTAQTLPLSDDSASYIRERVFDRLEMNAPVLNVYNDGPGTWYVRHSHDGHNFSEEFPIFEGEAKTYLNIYELRHRAPIVDLNYRITEFELWKQKNVEYFAGNPYISETFVANIGLANANIEDIRNGNSTINGVARDDTAQALNRNAHSGDLANLGLGNLFVAFDDGNGYSNERTIPPNNAQPLDGMDIARLRIRTDVINTAYRLAAQ